MAMFGINATLFDWVSLAVAMAITIYVVAARNPFQKGTDDYQALRLCRVAFALLAWSFGFGLIGIAFALAAFILAIIGIVKGRTVYGIVLIIGSMCVPIFSLIYSFSSLSV